MDLWSNKNIAKDLQNYVHILTRYDVNTLFSVDKLTGVAEGLSDLDYCHMDEIEIEFYNRKRISKTFPAIKDFKISLLTSLSSKPGVDAQVNDPIACFSFDLLIVGFCDVENKKFVNCWHLDKDIKVDSDGNPNGEAKYTHPLYHFQFGGKHLNEIQSSGDLLLMGAPRIPHPPMDVFLAIHFVLHNYFSKSDPDYSFLKDLFEDVGYQDILETAKQRMWYPYFNGLSPAENQNEELNLANLFPLAV